MAICVSLLSCSRLLELLYRLKEKIEHEYQKNGFKMHSQLALTDLANERPVESADTCFTQNTVRIGFSNENAHAELSKFQNLELAYCFITSLVSTIMRKS